MGIRGKIIKLMESKWNFVNRCDGIMYQRHVNELRHNREIRHETTENGKGTGQSEKQYNYCDRYEIVNKNRFSGHNENIKEQTDNENTLKSNQSRFSNDIVTCTVVNKDCDKSKDKYVV